MINRREFALLTIAAVAVLALGGCGKKGGRSYNYKLTVEVETPDGIHKGSSVIASLGGGQIPGFEALGGGGPRARGEAVAVDLPNGKTLFALLRSENNADWAGSAHLWQVPVDRAEFASADDYYDAVRSDQTVYLVKRWVELPGDRPPFDNYPMLVTFKDIKDPLSVERVDPDDLAASFGAGYQLKAITVRVTDEAVTTGIQKRLNVIGIRKGQGLDRTKEVTANPTLAQRIGFSDFVKGQN